MYCKTSPLDSDRKKKLVLKFFGRYDLNSATVFTLSVSSDSVFLPLKKK